MIPCPVWSSVAAPAGWRGLICVIVASLWSKLRPGWLREPGGGSPPGQRVERAGIKKSGGVRPNIRPSIKGLKGERPPPPFCE